MSNKGFTMIELLVVMGVIVIFTSIFFVDYGGDSKTFALERSVNKLAQDLRRTQEMAMTGLIGDANTNAYGMYFDKVNASKSYIVYKNNDSVYTYDSSSDSIKETISLEKGLKICDILIGTGSVNTLSLSFVPPEPTNYINTYYSGYEASVVLCVENDEAKTRRVKINNTGRIETVNP